MAPKKGGKIGHFGAFFWDADVKMEESLSNLNTILACPLQLCVLSLEGKGAKLSSVGDFQYIGNLYMGVWVVCARVKVAGVQMMADFLD